MDLNTINSVARPQNRAELPVWTAGDAWLAGGTWLFSEAQVQLTRLIDLTDLKWPALTITENGLSIAATCTIAQLDALACPPEWLAAPLIDQCCRAFLASFKIWKTATVGGNLCMSLPAGPMISLTAALDGVCTIWQAGGGEQKSRRRRLRHRQPAQRARARRSAAADRYSAHRAEAALRLPPDLADAGRPLGGAADRQRRKRRRVPLDGDGIDPAAGTIIFRQDARPRTSCAKRSCMRITDDLYHNDVHGKPEWRKHMTLRLAEEIRSELADAGMPMSRHEFRDQRQDLFAASARPGSACARSCASSAISASRRAATPATAAPAPC